jgi:hypothetical protein
MLIRGLTALAVCALVLPTVGSSKHPVERPFKAAGIFTMAADSNDPLLGTFEIVGNATHLGKFVFPGDWQIVGATDTGLVFHIWGTYTAANGDTIEVDCPDWVTQYDANGNAVTSTGVVNIIGGTGRFANASGSYVGNIFPGDPMPFTAQGVISY